MSTTSTDLFPIEEVTFCTATIVTVDGHYVAVVRPGWIKFVSGAGPFEGQVFEGIRLEVKSYGSGSALRLVRENGTTVLLTSLIKSIDIHEN